MNKKLWFKLGALSTAVVPVMTVVACTPGTTMTNDDAKRLRDLTGSKMLRIYRQTWLTNVLKQKATGANEDAKLATIKANEIEMAKSYINNKLFSDNEWLRKRSIDFQKKIKDGDSVTLNSSKIKGPDLRTQLNTIYKMDQSYTSFEKWNTAIGTGNFTKFMNTYILDSQKIDSKPTEGLLASTDFKIDLDKLLVAEQYLKLNKDKWDNVFINDEDSDNYQSDVANDNGHLYAVLDKNNFPLVKLGVEKNYAYKWSIELNEDESYPFIEKDDISANDMIKQFIPSSTTTKTLANQIKVSAVGKKLGDTYSVFATNTIGDSTTQNTLLGYKGIAKLPVGGGKDILNFENKEESWKNKTSANFAKLTGFIKNGKLFSGNGTTKDDKVSFLESPDKLTIKKTLYRAIVPTYTPATKGKTATPAVIKFGAEYDLAKLIRAFVLEDKSIYTNAEVYYTDKNSEDREMLNFRDETIARKVKQAGLRFVKFNKDEE